MKVDARMALIKECNWDLKKFCRNLGKVSYTVKFLEGNHEEAKIAPEEIAGKVCRVLLLCNSFLNFPNMQPFCLKYASTQYAILQY